MFVFIEDKCLSSWGEHHSFKSSVTQNCPFGVPLVISLLGMQRQISTPVVWESPEALVLMRLLYASQFSKEILAFIWLLNFIYLFFNHPHCPPHSVLRMNHLSLGELCCLFCCPPCPSKIASKLAFLPPEPTYSLMCDDSGSRWTLNLSERADWQYSSREKDAIECFMTRTSRGNRIACMFVRCSPSARYTLLFSHGNAVDLGQMSSFYIGLGSRINCNVFSYDYSGYGASSGKPSEKNLYADVDAAWQALRSR